jgi:hypothetical protein
MSGGYAVASQASIPRPRGLSKIKRAKHYVEEKPMKLTFKQRIRNWLMEDNDDLNYISQDCVETAQLESDGMRLQVYKASGGYVVETRSYDRRKDQNNNTIHVITDEEDLGERIGKIIMMEALKG